MQQQDQSENIETSERDTLLSEPNDESQEPTPEAAPDGDTPAESSHSTGRFDWAALNAALVIAAFFALTARFNSQPAPSYVPAAVLSATGCGLLVTAIHKLRRRSGVGLREAALAGLGMAVLQFLVTFTYPNVWTTVTTLTEYGRAFVLTWALIALFATVLSLAGAALGHVAFAPARPVASRARKQHTEEDEDEEEEALEDEEAASAPVAQTVSADASPAISDKDTDDDEESVETEPASEEERVEAAVRPQRSLLNYVITIVLLGLLPMMAGYVFAASYDFLMDTINVNNISPALYPTLSLLSGILPWRLAAPINLSGQNGMFIVFTLLWRIPDSTLGNPNLFDVQALESLLFNAVGLAFLLLVMYNNERVTEQRRPAPWGIFLLLEGILGLILILPANLWLLRGLEGVLQMGGIVAALPTLQLINPTLFTLNLLTGILFCLIMGLITRRQYQLWTTPRAQAPVEAEKQD